MSVVSSFTNTLTPKGYREFSQGFSRKAAQPLVRSLVDATAHCMSSRAQSLNSIRFSSDMSQYVMPDSVQ